MPPPDPTGALLRNAIALRRFENTAADRAELSFDRLRRRIAELLLERDPLAVTAGRRERRLLSIFDEVDELLQRVYRRIARGAREDLADVGEIQSQFAGRQLQRLAAGAGIDLDPTLLTRAYIRSVIATDPVRGAVMRDWWRTQKRSAQFGFRRELRIGLAQSESVGQLVIRIRGRSAGGGRFTGGVLETSTREATALVRTAVNQIATTAHVQTYANSGITREYEWLAILDARTCPICQALDGRRFRYDDPRAPKPPAHFNCRCTLVPLVAGIAFERQDYAAWLRDQRASVQDEILGPGRGKLFRARKVSLEDMVRSDGSRVTLDELRQAAA